MMLVANPKKPNVKWPALPHRHLITSRNVCAWGALIFSWWSTASQQVHPGRRYLGIHALSPRPRLEVNMLRTLAAFCANRRI